MKTKITYRDLVKMRPCYHSNKIGIRNGYSASIPDFIREYRDKVKNKEDIIWVVCREDYMTEKDLRLFAVWCVREALKLVDSPDPRSIEACDVAERYANRQATDEELATADAAAAAEAAAMAAGPAVWSVMWSTARDAADAADAAWDAACDAQIDKLLTYFETND